MTVTEAVDRVAVETSFSGVVRVDRGGSTDLLAAYGDADQRWAIPNTPDTRFATASATKTLTALVVVTMIEAGTLDLATTARSLLGDDLPLIDDAVTVEQLLAHLSGIGDYLDEDTDLAFNDYLMPVPVHQLVSTEDFVVVLDGYPTKFPPGERFSYCNAGFMVLALIAERASGVPYHDLVAQRVCGPAGMSDTEFLRSDELPGRTAVGYLDVDGHRRSNVFHLPVRGNGDGGIYTTVADIHAFWAALFGGRIVSTDWVAEMTRPRSEVPDESMRYGLGFWLHETGDTVLLVGGDTGVALWAAHDPTRDLTCTVISNTSNGASPVARVLAQLIDE